MRWTIASRLTAVIVLSAAAIVARRGSPEPKKNLRALRSFVVRSLNREGAKETKWIKEEGVIDIETIAADIVDSAIKVHRALGPGLLESAYQRCHSYELRHRGHRVENEVVCPLMYGDEFIDAGYRIDTLVDGLIIVENKTVDALAPIHEAQLLTHLKLKDLHLGFLLNRNVTLMKHGIQRLVRNLPGIPQYPGSTPK